MKAFKRLAVILAVAYSLSGGFAQAKVTGLPDFTQLAKDNSPAVVNISSTIKPSKSGNRLPPGFSNPDIPEDSPLSEFFRRFFGEEGLMHPAASIRGRRSAQGSSFPLMAMS